METDAELIRRVLARMTPANRHDVRNKLAIYEGLASLVDDCDEANAYLHVVVEKLNVFADTGEFPAIDIREFIRLPIG